MAEFDEYRARWFAAGSVPAPMSPPYQRHYRVPMLSGNALELPLRPLPDGERAIALLMANQTTFAIERSMTELLVTLARGFAPEVIAGVPTLGLDYARTTAQALGMQNYVALGFSRKFWYDDAWSEAASSITSVTGKRLYLDPALLPRVRGRKVLVVDDVINTGGTAAAAIRLLQRAGAQVVGLVVALSEGHAWRKVLQEIAPDWPQRVRAAGHIPMFRSVAGGWEPIPETLTPLSSSI